MKSSDRGPDAHEKPAAERIAIVDEVLRGRRTVHKFLPTPPPRAVIEEAVELARWAPNHKLTHPFRFHLLGRRAIERIAGLNARLVREKRGEEAARAKLARWLDQPGWLVCTAHCSPENPVRHQEDYAAASCAIHNLSLALWARGVGVKWTSGDVIRTDEFHAVLGLDPGEEYAVGLLWYGYPAEVPDVSRPAPERYLRDVE